MAKVYPLVTSYCAGKGSAALIVGVDDHTQRSIMFLVYIHMQTVFVHAVVHATTLTRRHTHTHSFFLSCFI